MDEYGGLQKFDTLRAPNCLPKKVAQLRPKQVGNELNLSVYTPAQ
jgi:hypothetical protein